jgi:RNA-directed DNA polymerase
MKKRSLKDLLDAMYQGKFEFPELDTGDISTLYETKNYNDRELHIPNKKLKTFHSFLNLFLLEYLQTNKEIVFSYQNMHTANIFFKQTLPISSTALTLT